MEMRRGARVCLCVHVHALAEKVAQHNTAHHNNNNNNNTSNHVVAYHTLVEHAVGVRAFPALAGAQGTAILVINDEERHIPLREPAACTHHSTDTPR